ncbi:nucleotide pyrophosphohydrolase [Marinobacter vulgaris]|uniref:Nucleotide pyrophosphohydrolase n=1 Tax=Marinobacter vulgaris TaxID=1928331 RepID=A0A2V3ZPW9_9GAMM|nr:nucleotide pyrophosphohydrolase [Marinobacter vulgaris]PXX92247.1 nucleotide pyrophosphohydrolase [Marinobacter vulgaris]TSJ71810.1 nucleotide pyrophosphohydrolase [Marinobacter vulgaris]
MDIEGINGDLRKFVKERDWDQFQSPKNLAMALGGEVGELLDVFQWLTEEKSYEVMDDPKLSKSVEEEVADVQIYLLRLIDTLGIDLEAIVRLKMQKNEQKYPIEEAKGNAVKYSRRT